MKKNSIYYYFILSYVLVFICGFLIIDLWTSKQNETLLIKSTAKSLYDSANVLCDSIASEELENIDQSPDLQNKLNVSSKSLNCVIQIIERDGTILYNTSDEKTDSIPEFDITNFGSSYYMLGSFYQYFDQKMLSIAVPITYNFQTKGYLLLHYEISHLADVHLNVQNIIYVTCFFIFLLSLIILLMFTLIVFLPIKKISTAAHEYAKGNFTYEGLSKFTSDNEIGRLGLSLQFMAHELNTMESDERKFIANISHDFRSPLTSIKGYIEAMKDGTIPAGMQEKYLDIVLFETERLTKLTENLLTLNKWDTRGTRLNIKPFNIYSLIKQNMASLEGKCEKKRIRFQLTSDNKYYLASADKDKINQVIYNLLDNAVKFSHHDSVIIVTLSSKGEKLFISVKDSGIGIPKDCQNKIWDRFYKTDLSRGKDKTGSGLGLSITREIIQAHGENINVISTEGVGTEFIFTLKKEE